MIKEFISKVVRGDDLTEIEMEKAMDEIMSGTATPAQIGSFITALRLKGESVDEIAGAAKAMRTVAPASGVTPAAACRACAPRSSTRSVATMAAPMRTRARLSVCG